MRIRTTLTAASCALAMGALGASTATADTVGSYIVADDLGATGAAVYSFTPAGARTTIAVGAPLVNPEGLARVGADDYLVADKGEAVPADGSVIRIRKGVQSVLATGGNLFDPHGIALSADRKTAFVAGRDGRIVAITIATGAQRLVANLAPGDLRGIAVERTGSLLVADQEAPTTLRRVDPNSGAATTLYTGPTPASDLRSVLVMPNTNIVMGDQGVAPTPNGGLVTGPAAGPFTSIAGGAFFAGSSVPGALALDTGGNVVVVDRNGPATAPGRIYKVSLTGVLTPIVSDASALLVEPGGLAIVPPKCGGKFATIVGTPGKDILPGTNGPDVIVALGGKDTVKGKGGKDLICGGKGADRLLGGGGKDRVIGGKGKDVEKP
jgi:hypothetical protein